MRGGNKLPEQLRMILRDQDFETLLNLTFIIDKYNMALTYTATGGIEVLGCASVRATPYIPHQFDIGDILYNCKKAEQKGILEKIKIKRLIYNNNSSTFLHNVVLYVDMYNSLWNENELCTEEEAKELAAAYLEEQRRLALDALRRCY